MNAQVNEFITQYKLFNPNDPLLVAVSGGKDSMALLYFLKENNYKFEVAHCNFQLRGAESDADEAFIVSYCEEKQINYHIHVADTETFAKEKSISIQEAAREIRYTYLEEKRQEINAKYILTAHHLQDNLETLYFKIVKGTGMKGLRGMEPKNGVVVRPFLETSLERILVYVKEKSIPFREDSSNSSVKYSRNKIRHELIPILQELNPQLNKTMLKHFDRWREMNSLYEDMLEAKRKELFEYRNGAKYIAIGKLKNFSYRKSLLFGIIEPYGFNNSDVEDIFKSVDLGNEVKEFNSSTHKLIKDRKFLILQDAKDLDQHQVFVISENTKKVTIGLDGKIHLARKPIAKLSKMHQGENHCYLDTEKIKFPLVLRRWESGDYFYPLGMYKESGKRSKKNIGKFLRDLKMDARLKQHTWVLSTAEKIVWVVGIRADDRFKLTDITKEVLHISLK